LIGKSTVKEVMALVMRKCVESTKPGDFVVERAFVEQ
jgi:hypothetical protein